MRFRVSPAPVSSLRSSVCSSRSRSCSRAPRRAARPKTTASDSSTSRSARRPRQEAAALAQLDEIRAGRVAIEARVADLDRQITAAEARLVPLVAEADRLAESYTILQGKVDRTQAKLDGARHDFEVSAAEQYRSARRGSSYDVVLAARPKVLVQQDKYLDHVSRERDALVQRVESLRQRLETQRRELEDQKRRADEARAEAQSARDQVATLRTEIEPARVDAAQRELAEGQVVAEIQAQKGDFEAELASLQAASDSIAARLRALGSGPGSPGSCQARPVPGQIIESVRAALPSGAPVLPHAQRRRHVRGRAVRRSTRAAPVPSSWRVGRAATATPSSSTTAAAWPRSTPTSRASPSREGSACRSR